ncbi:hypothetical protein B0T17DRAFT_512128 [Bombardia bombarda]|uniref:Uncharacterized protein n=1 Tax=Bombardia bombarda TaxID=252184 RepID=A0AA39U2Y0_9PEZI|nr:hypothetical protein B0T17DRAFT_512128 [Bombardia bombarda]
MTSLMPNAAKQLELASQSFTILQPRFSTSQITTTTKRTMSFQSKDPSKQSKLLADFGSSLKPRKSNRVEISRVLHRPQTTHSTISKDKTKGEAAYRANLFAYFGKKLQKAVNPTQESKDNGEFHARRKDVQSQVHRLMKEAGSDGSNDELAYSRDFETCRMMVENKAKELCSCEKESKEIQSLYNSTTGRKAGFKDWDQLGDILDHLWDHKIYSERRRSSLSTVK